MGYTIKFMHGETYSAEDVNDVFSKLTTQGVSSFDYTGDVLNGLNEATSALVSEGVDNEPTALKLIKENDVYKIMPGTAFMYDGSTITVDSDGYLLEGFSVGENYVYIKRRKAFNDIVFVVSSETWTENDVPIAIVTISKDGSCTITDKREFSTAKIRGFFSQTRTDYLKSGQDTILFSLDNGQDYKVCMIAREDWGRGTFNTLVNNDTIELVDDVRTATLKIKKEGVKYTVSASPIGVSKNFTYTIYFA